MPSPLLQDRYEPEYIFGLLRQGCPAELWPLNDSGNADYFWFDCFGNSRQLERKQWGEVLGGMDRVEIQLRKEIQLADATDLLIEGVVKATQWGMDAYVWDGLRYRYSHSFGDPDHPQQGLYSKVMAWLWQLEKAGITTWFTFSQEDTARAIATFYRKSQEPDHGTLSRYLKPKIHIRELNPQVLSLMGIEGAGLGRVRAQELIAKFGTVYGVLTAPAEELSSCANMGKATVSKLFKAIGRLQ